MHCLGAHKTLGTAFFKNPVLQKPSWPKNQLRSRLFTRVLLYRRE